MAKPTIDQSVMNRRTFLSRISIALTALAGAVVAIPMVAYLLSPLLKPAINVWVPLGTTDGFPVGQTVEAVYHDPSPVPWAGLTALTAVWVRHVAQDQFIVFAVNCTHLGCPVRWVPDASLFICPCHGGVYYADGAVAAGPPPLPLFRYDNRVLNGVLEIRTRPLPVG
jgi:quinol---cytochrome c reductase iron-sulfur subunit, bacillus type